MSDPLRKCIKCQVVVDEVGESVVLFCSCLIVLCSQCAKAEVLEKKGFRKQCITCPACQQATNLKSIMLNQEQIVNAEWDLISVACAHFGRPLPSFSRKTEKLMKDILLCFPVEDFPISQEILESKSVSELMTYIAYLERERELRELPVLDVRKNPEDLIKFASNSFLERVLHLISGTEKNDFRVSTTCIACYLEIPAKQSVLQLCDCVDSHLCLSCTYQHLANQPDTYHNGLHCPSCSRASAVIGSIGAAEVIESKLIDEACSQFKVRKESKDALLQLCGAYRSVGMKSSFDLTSTSKEYNDSFLRLEVARLETARQNGEKDATKWMGPLAQLTFHRHKFLEIFLSTVPYQGSLYHDQPRHPYAHQSVGAALIKQLQLNNRIAAQQLRGMYSPFQPMPRPQRTPSTAVKSLEQLASMIDLVGGDTDQDDNFSRMQISSGGGGGGGGRDSEGSDEKDIIVAVIPPREDKLAKRAAKDSATETQKEQSEEPYVSYRSYFHTQALEEPPLQQEPTKELSQQGKKIAEAYSTVAHRHKGRESEVMHREAYNAAAKVAAKRAEFMAVKQRDAYNEAVMRATSPTSPSVSRPLPPGFKPPPPTSPPPAHLDRHGRPYTFKAVVEPPRDYSPPPAPPRTHFDLSLYKHGTQLVDVKPRSKDRDEDRDCDTHHHRVHDRTPDWKFNAFEKDEEDHWKEGSRHSGRYFQTSSRDREDQEDFRHSLPKRRQLPQEHYAPPRSFNEREIIDHRETSDVEPITYYEDRTGGHHVSREEQQQQQLREPRAQPGLERKAYQYQPAPPPPPTPQQEVTTFARTPVYSTGFEWKYVTNYDLPKYNPTVDASVVPSITADLEERKRNSIRALCQSLEFDPQDEFTLYFDVSGKVPADKGSLSTHYTFSLRIYFDPYYEVKEKHPEYNKYAAEDANKEVFYQTTLTAHSARTTLTMLPSLLNLQVGLVTPKLMGYKLLGRGIPIKHKTTLGELFAGSTGALELRIVRPQSVEDTVEV